jgi:DNA sulfur modification protein DndB
MLSALYHANRIVLADRKVGLLEGRSELATEFGTEVEARIAGWSEVVCGNTSAAEASAGYCHSHAIGIEAIARAGRVLLAQFPKGW